MSIKIPESLHFYLCCKFIKYLLSVFCVIFILGLLVNSGILVYIYLTINNIKS